MVVVVFRTRLKDGCDGAALEELGARMYALAAGMPGFVAYKDFTAGDGEYLTLVEFTDARSLAAWRDHPEHREAQERGRREFFSAYHIQVGTIEREYDFSQDAGRRALLG